MEVLGKHDVYIIGPEKLSGFLEAYKKRTESRFQIALYQDKFFNSISGYNRLLMSRFFYRSFREYEFMLIVQTDALVFSDQLDVWCDRNYSYIGAPWFVGENKPEQPLTFMGVGNGGFSLRKISDFIRFLSVPQYVPNFTLEYYFKGGINAYEYLRKIVHKIVLSYNFPPFMPHVSEDVFWGLLVSKCSLFFTVPEAEDAVSFAFEEEPAYLYGFNNNLLPFGCHAWEKYDKKFWKTVLSQRGIILP